MTLKERVARLFRFQSFKDDAILEEDIAPWNTPTRKIRKIRPEARTRPNHLPTTNDFEYDKILTRIAPEEEGEPLE